MEFTLTAKFNVSAEKIYSAWLTSEEHTAMTGGDANINDKVGDTFTAWDGYISGMNLELEPGKRILQSWRTTQFEDAEEDSQIEVLLKETEGVTELTLIHRNLSENGGHYKKGWEDHYFAPMRVYFGE